MTRRFTMHQARAASDAAERKDRLPRPPANATPGNGTQAPRPKEIGGPAGPEPTRYGDWERNGICYDF